VLDERRIAAHMSVIRNSKIIPIAIMLEGVKSDVLTKRMA
jgi:hypothetical protein